MIQIANKLTLNVNRHVMKFGTSVHSATPGGLIHSNLDGTYTFAPGAPFPYNPEQSGLLPGAAMPRDSSAPTAAASSSSTNGTSPSSRRTTGSRSRISR